MSEFTTKETAEETVEYVPGPWSCKLFNGGKSGITLTPPLGSEPNWFWRQMQYLILGNLWVKDETYEWVKKDYNNE